MKRFFIHGVLLLVFAACNDSGEKETAASENDIDAARNFIDASLKRDWSKAKNFMLQDSANVERLDKIESFYVNENREDKRGYREASITMYDTRKVNDSISIVNYSNSYKNKRDSLKLVRINGQWLVDLKYSFLPPDSVKNVQ